MNSTDLWLQLQTLESKILNVKAEAWKNHQLLNTRLKQAMSEFEPLFAYQQSQLKELERQVIALKKMLPRPVLELNTPIVSESQSPAITQLITQLPTQLEGNKGGEGGEL